MHMTISNKYRQAEQQFQQARIAHWNKIAKKRDSWKGFGAWYHRRLIEIYSYLIPSNQRVLEIGCGMGDLLAALKPKYGLGVDFSKEMLARAQEKYPHLEFIQIDAHNLSKINASFDFIILSDAVNDMWDVQRVIEQLRPLCTMRTRIILNSYSRLWEIPLMVARKINLATPTLEQNWFTVADLSNILNLAGFEVIRNWQEVFWPLPLGDFANKFLVRFWPFRELALSNFVVARPRPSIIKNKNASVSVIIPARNESGNVTGCFNRVPKMGTRTELIFVEGHSHDDTYATIEQEIHAHPSIPSQLLQQTGIGKADAVRLGFAHATGDILMILDADLTVPAEDLPRFYNAVVSGKGEFINGVRLIYPMEAQAMRGLNFLGNKFFSLAFSWILGQPIKDTLCGTKVFMKKDYEKIAANRTYFGDFDPFGDYDLIFGAAKLNLKIVDLPIRYHERTYGNTNIDRWRHGLLLLRIGCLRCPPIKFI